MKTKINMPQWVEDNTFQIHYIYTKFIEVGFKYTHDLEFLDSLFLDVFKKYSSKGRHYHTMTHIYRLCRNWSRFKHKLNNKDAVFFAIIYHDIIYKPTKKDNEEMSAEYFLTLAMRKKFDADIAFIQNVVDLIKITKHGSENSEFIKLNKDFKYMLDFDLEIIGEPKKEIYNWYREGVRKEYRIYPNFLYKPGRKAVLESFLKNKIYLTEEFKIREKNAKKNLQNEINLYLC